MLNSLPVSRLTTIISLNYSAPGVLYALQERDEVTHPWNDCILKRADGGKWLQYDKFGKRARYEERRRRR